MLVQTSTRIRGARETVLYHGPFNRGIVNGWSTPPLEGYCRYPLVANIAPWENQTVSECSFCCIILALHDKPSVNHRGALHKIGLLNFTCSREMQRKKKIIKKPNIIKTGKNTKHLEVR